MRHKIYHTSYSLVPLFIVVTFTLPTLGTQAHAALLGPISEQTQEANTGLILGFTETDQRYTEFPPVAGLPNPLDSQTGTIPGIELGYQNQHSLIGWGIVFNVGHGTTTYQGYRENLQTGALTTDMVPTGNITIGGHGWIDVGFSPRALPALSFAPGLLLGIHSWGRNNANNPGGSNEVYGNGYVAVRLLTRYAYGPVVVGLTTDAGRAFHASMQGGPDGGVFPLGDGPWDRVGLTVTYNMFSAASLFVSYSETMFRYGQSAVDANGYMEPSSRTINNQAEVGINAHL